MRGRLKYVKFPQGIYYCEITEVRPGVSSKGDELVVVHYRVLEGEKTGETFKETLRFVSDKFLAAIGEPHELNTEWNTDNWPGKTVYVDVKYSPDENQWPRFGHHNADPRIKEPPVPVGAKGKDDDSIPF